MYLPITFIVMLYPMLVLLLCISAVQYKLYVKTTHVPAKISKFMTQEKFAKARLYQLDKSNFSFWHGIFGQVEGVVSAF